MTVINTNIKALFAQNALQINNRSLTTAMQQLSTGKRINSAADDAAGMAISTRMTQQIQSLDQAVRNAGDAISLIQTTEGATNEITTMLQRMRELSVQAINDTNANDQRSYLNLEFQQLKQQIVQIANNTEWNGFAILNGTAGQQVGPVPVERATGNGQFNSSGILTTAAPGDVVIQQPVPDPTQPGGYALDSSQPGGLKIQTFTVPAASASNDALSSSNNAASSAIAKAAAINTLTSQTGITAVVGTTVMTGSAMSGSDPVTGCVTINGYTSADFTTVLNNPSLSRAAVINAINSMTKDTGVVAIDSGSDAGGVRLEAKDGRNIEVILNNSSADQTGLKVGAQSGSYSLQAKIETKFSIVAGTGEISNFGLCAGNYDSNVSMVSTNPRASVSPGELSVPLLAGDLVINGVAIPASTGSTGYLNSSSATAITAAINTQSAKTGVTAQYNPASIVGTIDESPYAPANADVLVNINGVSISIAITTGETYNDRQNAVVAAIKAVKNNCGVDASISADGKGVTLTAIDGRNVSVWTDAPDVLGLQSDQVKTIAGDAVTVYGGVTLSSTIPDSPQPLPLPGQAPPFDGLIHVSAGINGFGASSHFTALGFAEGTYGGKSSVDMSPPRVGRMSFQVGADAGQTISIDLADFGSSGSITGAITSDAGAATPTIAIDTAAGATLVLGTLDDVMNNVNKTRATMGAVMNRMEHVIDNLTNVSTNTTQSRSQIEDADYAKASSAMARAQIIAQAATAVLAQANTSQQTVLKLLQ